MSKQVHIVGPYFSYSSLITIGVFLIALSLSIFADTVQSDEIAPDKTAVGLSAIQPETVGGAHTDNSAAIDNGSDVKAGNGAAQSQLLKERQLELNRLERAVAEEEQLMANNVQIMDRDEAVQWMARFISLQPLNCPLKPQMDWINAIIDAVERNRLPICKEALGLVSSLVAMESGFRVDPLAVDPSREEDMSSLLSRAEKEFEQKFGMLLRIPPVPRFYAAYKEKYYSRLLACKTEGEVEVIARKIAD